jgi:hypothetical protein
VKPERGGLQKQVSQSGSSIMQGIVVVAPVMREGLFRCHDDEYGSVLRPRLVGRHQDPKYAIESFLIGLLRDDKTPRLLIVRGSGPTSGLENRFEIFIRDLLRREGSRAPARTNQFVYARRRISKLVWRLTYFRCLCAQKLTPDTLLDVACSDPGARLQVPRLMMLDRDFVRF